MRKFFLSALILTGVLLQLTSQPSIQWQKCLGGSKGEQAWTIQQTRGFIVAGYSKSNDGDVSGNLGYIDATITALFAFRLIVKQFV